MEDIEIARNAKLKRINEITDKLNIPEEYVEQYGKYKAKISLNYYDKIKNNKTGKLILITSINPTPYGEGKITASIGLEDGLCKIGKKSILCLREPSLGPVFGIKGGATGGGFSQVAPMEDINLHFTGDIHAITSANNLLSALIDNHIFHGNELKIKKVTWRRCIDLNDRELRTVEVGLSPEKKMQKREDHFDITVASEIMAILCLATDLNDLKRRLGNIVIGYNENDEKVRCKDLKAEGSLAVLLKDAINPNIVQTLENNPAIIHGGPFANIAHGCNSLIATKMGLKLADYVVTEAGFGADLGAEKFLDIKTRKLGKVPDAVVIVATIRALKYHGKNESNAENEIEQLKNGIRNLRKHIQNMQNFGMNVIVAINKFSNDTDEEISILKNEVENNLGVQVSLLENWAKGSEGATDLAEKVVALCNESDDQITSIQIEDSIDDSTRVEVSDEKIDNKINYTYNLNDSLKEKIEKVATKIYGAEGVEYSEDAEEQIEKMQNDLEANNKPICIAKTQYSLSDDAKNLNPDLPFKIHITNVEYKAGAEFIVIKTGNVMTMPGLPKVPAAESIDVDENGNIVGIF